MDDSTLYQSSYITVKAIGNEQAENDEDLVEIQPHDGLLYLNDAEIEEEGVSDIKNK